MYDDFDNAYLNRLNLFICIKYIFEKYKTYKNDLRKPKTFRTSKVSSFLVRREFREPTQKQNASLELHKKSSQKEYLLLFR